MIGARIDATIGWGEFAASPALGQGPAPRRRSFRTARAAIRPPVSPPVPPLVLSPARAVSRRAAQAACRAFNGDAPSPRRISRRAPRGEGGVSASARQGRGRDPFAQELASWIFDRADTEPTPSRHQADTEQARAGGAVPSRARRWRARDGRGADSAGPRGAHRRPFAGRAAAGRHAGAWARAARHSRRRCRRDDLSARHAKGGRAAPLIAVDALPVSPGVCAPRRPAARGRQARAGLWQAAARRPLYSQCR
jgi:hypothetical protein